MILKTVIADDEPYAIQILQQYAAQIPELQVVGTATDAIQTFQLLQSQAVDLLFVDIKMPGITGTELVRSLRNPPMVVFSTAYQEYAVEGFDLNAIDYLLKPVSLPRFLQAMDKVLHYRQGARQVSQSAGGADTPPTVPDQFLYLRIDRTVVRVNTKDILWVESIRDYIKVVTATDRYQTKQKISVTEKLLPSGRFLRVHRSFIVPIARVAAYHPSYVLIGEEKIPIGRNYKDICAKQFDPLNSAGVRDSLT